MHFQNQQHLEPARKEIDRTLEVEHGPFVADMTRPGLLHGAVVYSVHARAKILNIELSKARQLAGVVAVLTAVDVPGERYQGLLERDWPVLVAIGEEARCVGDVVAIIAAEDVEIAREAAKLVEVEYDVLDPVDDPESALAALAPRVNSKRDNLLGRSAIQRGNAEDELARSQYVARGTFSTHSIDSFFVQPECALAEMLPNGRLCVHSQGQGFFEDARQIASMLGCPEDRVVVHLAPNGGAFGADEDLTILVHVALLAWKTGRPVKLSLDHNLDIPRHPTRHPMRLEYEVGCDAEGHLTAVRARILGDGGAYASVGAKILEMVASHAAGVYLVSHVDIEARVAYTNNSPNGAMRGFGVPQVMFALESCIDELAGLTGLDRWEIRYRNAVRAGDLVTTGQVLDKSSIGRCLMAVKPAWQQAKKNGIAIGIACGIKNAGAITTYGFAVQLVVLDEAGHVVRVIAAHDAGRANNPAVSKRAIEVSVRRGLRYALPEEFASEKGKSMGFSVDDIGVSRTRHIPNVEVILVEEKEGEGIFGPESVAEIGLVPTAAAVVSALRAADGIIRRELPLKDSTTQRTTGTMRHVHNHAPRVYVHRGSR